MCRYVRDQRVPFTTLEMAAAQCDREPSCSGVTRESDGLFTMRTSPSLYHSPIGETSWIKSSVVRQQQQQQQQQQQTPYSNQQQPPPHPPPSSMAQNQQYENNLENAYRRHGIPYTYDEAVSRLPNLAALAGLSNLAALNKIQTPPPPPPVDPLAIVRAKMNGFVAELERCYGSGSSVSVQGNIGSTIEPQILQAVQYCSINKCESKTMAWVWLNLALKFMRPCGQFNPYAHNAHLLPRQQVNTVRNLFLMSLEEEQGDGDVWLKLATFENSQGEEQKCVETLLKGATVVVDKAQKIELYHTLGVHMHDHRMWEYSYQAFKSAILVADESPNDKV
jgi:hypothetical protein